MNINGAIQNITFAMPHFRKYLFTREHALGILCQQTENAKFLGRKVYVFTANRHHLSLEINFN